MAEYRVLTAVSEEEKEFQISPSFSQGADLMDYIANAADEVPEVDYVGSTQYGHWNYAATQLREKHNRDYAYFILTVAVK